MTPIPKLSAILRDVLLAAAEAAERTSGFVQRRSKLSGPVFVQTLVWGWLETPVASLQTLCLMASRLGVSITPQGLEQRFTPQAAAYLQTVLAAAVRQVVASAPAVVPILQRFPGGVYIQDSTTIALPAAYAAGWPGCGNASTPAAQSASMKLQVRLELTTGALDGPVPHPGRVHDRAAPPVGPALPTGALFLADLGYFRLAHLRHLADAGVF